MARGLSEALATILSIVFNNYSSKGPENGRNENFLDIKKVFIAGPCKEVLTQDHDQQ